MDVLTKEEFMLKKDRYLQLIKEGALFIHPTDTIYGLGCNALNDKAVKKIRRMKERPDTPLSIWAPSIKWIREFCVVTQEVEEWFNKLPGSYTLILKLKKKHPLANQVNPKNGTVGVRLPNHWFSEVVQMLDLPIITTSANKRGQNFMTSLETLDGDLAKNVSFTIYEGEKKGRPSKLINLAEETTSVTKR